MKKPVINPEVLRILSDDPTPSKKENLQILPQPEISRKSFWGKLWDGIKKAVPAILSILSICLTALNVIARYKETFPSTLQGAI